MPATRRANHNTPDARPVRIAMPGDAITVGGLAMVPRNAHACYVMAHGAGAGMTHPFMEAAARGLAERRIATLRYQFPYMERGTRRPDLPQVAQGAVRAAVCAAAACAPGMPLIAGGKSFGGRMTSQAQAESPLDGVIGLAFLGFPLHPPNAPAIERATHLARITLPLLFLQGDGDALASLPLLQGVVSNLGPRATLRVLAHADHAFHVKKRSGRTDDEVMHAALDALAEWTEALTVPRT